MTKSIAIKDVIFSFQTEESIGWHDLPFSPVLKAPAVPSFVPTAEAHPVPLVPTFLLPLLLHSWEGIRR